MSHEVCCINYSVWIDLQHDKYIYLTITRRRRGDYKLIFTEPRGEYEHVITEPEATNCFSINFQVNILSLSR